MQNNLEVAIITYNRVDNLKNTLEQVFDENSPIKSFQITILDNNSNDGTNELIKEYTQKFSNIKHIKHNRNIGASANTARAFEIATKKYIWVICDDDNFTWENWGEVEEAINQDKDIIVISKCELKRTKKVTLGKILREISFLPGGIYKTELITNDVMQNIMTNTANLFPHLVIACSAINQNKEIHIINNEITLRGESNKLCYIRSYETNNIHPRAKELFFIVGYINSIQIIKDKKLRAKLIDNMDPKDIGFFRMISKNFKNNRIKHNNSFRNIAEVFSCLNFRQKIEFCLSLIWTDFLYFIRKFILRHY